MPSKIPYDTLPNLEPHLSGNKTHTSPLGCPWAPKLTVNIYIQAPEYSPNLKPPCYTLPSSLASRALEGRFLSSFIL